MPERDVILPGSTVGVVGGGQLGRMLAVAARRMGYRVHVLEPKPDSPAGQLADRQHVAEYDDLDAARAFAREVDVVTFEFENIPAETLRAIESIRPIRPSPELLHATRHRAREKHLLHKLGAPLAPFHVCESADDVVMGLKTLGVPAILKTSEFGYDGKGQVRLDGPAVGAARGAWEELGARSCVLEKVVAFEWELSVVCARSVSGAFVPYVPVRNDHERSILDVTRAPASLAPRVAERAIELARTIAEAGELVGVLAVEMFLMPGDELAVNELAPRPHNSGHFSFDACVSSQFEQQLRAVCGLPLGDPSLTRPAAAMANLLGDLWFPELEPGADPGDASPREPDWAAVLEDPAVKLHLYGKPDPRPGRKMGHLCALADDADAARRIVASARRRLCERAGDGARERARGS